MPLFQVLRSDGTREAIDAINSPDPTDAIASARSVYQERRNPLRSAIVSVTMDGLSMSVGAFVGPHVSWLQDDHTCQPPIGDRARDERDWTCLECGQVWTVR